MITQVLDNCEYYFTTQSYQNNELRVVRFSGTEGISEPYKFEIDLTARTGMVTFDSIVGKTAALTIIGRRTDRYIHGLVTRIELIKVLREEHEVFRVYMSAPMVKLGLVQQVRIFQKKTTQQIVSNILKEGGINNLKWALQETYKPRDYCVQYCESNLDFISRLLEEEGIAYRFKHTQSNVQMVFSDKVASFDEIEDPSTVIFHTGAGLQGVDEAVSRFTYSQQMRTGKVELRDYNFKKPQKPVKAKAEGTDKSLEMYDYPGEFVDSSLANRLAKVRLQELETEQKVGDGISNCSRLSAGYIFSLGGAAPWERYPQQELNQKYLLTRVFHEGHQGWEEADIELGGEGDNYTNTFSVIPATTEFRPPRVTPRPKVVGMLTADVVGPSGEEIYTDEFGRVKVQFHWDREGENNEKSSCWIRVSHNWAGKNWGSIYIPRVGQEVLVSFLGGDPDRPIITGRVYNGLQKVPYPLPAGKSQSTMKSDSTPGGSGSNEIRFEDKKGSEEVYIHAQKDQNEKVENNMSTTVGADQSISVGNNRSVTTEKNETITNNSGDRTRTVKSGNDTINIDTGNRSVTVKGDTSLRVTSGGRTVDVDSKGYTLNVKDGHSVNVTSGGQTFSVKDGGQKFNIDSGDHTVTISSGKGSIKASGAISITSSEKITAVGSKKVKISGKKVAITGSEEVSIGVGANNITIKSDGVSIGGVKISSSAIGVHEISGAMVKIN